MVDYTTQMEGVGAIFDVGELVSEGVGGFVEDSASMLSEGSSQSFRYALDVWEAQFDIVGVIVVASGEVVGVQDPRGVVVGREG